MDGLLSADYQRVLTRLGALANDPRPHGCEKLHDDVYRIRVGNIRVIYLVDDTIKRVEIGAIRRRSERTYKGTNDLFG